MQPAQNDRALALTFWKRWPGLEEFSGGLRGKLASTTNDPCDGVVLLDHIPKRSYQSRWFRVWFGFGVVTAGILREHHLVNSS